MLPVPAFKDFPSSVKYHLSVLADDVMFYNVIFKFIFITSQPNPADSGSVKKSELLPPGWNDEADAYTLRYQYGNEPEVYILKIIRMQDTLLVHVMVRPNKIICLFPLTRPSVQFVLQFCWGP